MSGFFGIFSPGGNVDQLAFDQMKSAINKEGYDELGIFINENIVLGHLMLRVTPASINDNQPLKSECGRYILVGHFRLDYRDELGDKLGIRQNELDITPDSKLVILSFLKWNENCIKHIEGDWSFVIFDRLDNKIWCFKDKFGVSAIYYAIHNNQFIFSSSIQSFQKLKGDSFAIDFNQLYRLSFDGIGFGYSKTMLKGVYCLGPSNYLNIDSNLKIKHKEYFNFETKFKIRYRFEEDYILDFITFFSSAIRSRIAGVDNIGIFQSSGLDSNAILYFASKELEYKKTIISTYTAHNFFLNRIDQKLHSRVSDDELFKKSLYLYKNVNPSFLDFCDVDFEREFHQSEYDLDNPIVTKSKFWLRGIIQKAKKDDIQLMFTGQLGNFTITWNAPHFLLSELYKFKVRSVLRGIKGIKRKSNLTYRKIFKLSFLIPFIRQIKVYVKNISGRTQKNLVTNSIFKIPLGQKIDWRKEIRSSTSVLSIPLCISTEKLRKKLLFINSQVTGIRWYSEGFSNALITSDPTIDERLVKFLFNIPEFYFNKDGSSKYLFRKMMKGRIYEPLLSNNTTIEQSFDLAYRILGDKFFNNYLSLIIENKELGKVFKLEMLKSDYEYLKSQNSEISKYLVAMKLLKNISIVYLYDSYASRE